MQLELPLNTRARSRAGSDIIRAVRLGGWILDYRLRRSSRRTLALYVDALGVRAAAPRWVPIAEIERFIQDKERWILNKLAEARTARSASFDWTDGAELSIFGIAHRLKLNAGVPHIVCENDALHVPARCANIAQVRHSVLDWLKALALARFCEWAARLSATLEVAVPAVRLSNAQTRWGSCSIRRDGQGSIRLNWRLAMLPAHLGEYVVAHELSHLKEMNHSSRFWAWVARAYPDYQAAERELRRQGRTLPVL
jgi:predicted metal-dependent hydrolase